MLWSYFDQVATLLVPFTIDHLLSPAGRTRKQLAFEPFQVLQNPCLESFQVPSAFEPPVPIGSRVILPSAANTILYFRFAEADAVNGVPVKNVV